MDFYFTDRQFNLLEIISTDGTTPFKIIDDKETRSITAGSRMLEGTIVYTDKQAKRVSEIGALGNYILYVDEDGRGNFQTIVAINGHNNLTGEHTFTAENSTNDLLNETVDAYTADKAYPIATYIDRFTNDSGFEIGVNEISNLSRKLKWESTDETALARVLSVATQFDAELDFTFEFSGTHVMHRYINIRKHIGADKDVRLTQNKEINSITTTGDIYDLATSIRAIGGTPEGADKPITLAGYKYTDPTGRYVLSGQTVLDTVANRTWTRLLGGGTPSTTGAYLNRVITYAAVTQAELMQSVLSDLKKRVQPTVNYEVDIAVLPNGVDVGDTVHIVDENEELYLSARILELVISRSTGIITAKLGDYVPEESEINISLVELANRLKELANKPVFTWIAYADTADGQGISLFPDGKAYIGIAVNMIEKNADISDPSRFNWQLTKGVDGKDAVVLNVSSVNGNMFKNTGISTILTVSISVGGSILDTAEKMHAVFGADAYLQWQVKNVGELEFTDVSLTDTRLSDEGFLFAVSAADVNNKSTFKCELYY